MVQGRPTICWRRMNNRYLYVVTSSLFICWSCDEFVMMCFTGSPDDLDRFS
uniref:Uncharacterized protein n=1 Tax=Arundo donax TaxID=35708 RepID=A0A0A9CZE6_ARUDO